MSEEIMQNEATQAESMADYEAHFDDANPWNVVKGYMDNKTRLHIKIEGIVNGGAIAMVEGLRGFIPASRMSLSYIENLEDYLLKELDVIVIDVNEAENRLVLSAREILKEEEQKEREAQIAAIQAGSVLSGVVEMHSELRCIHPSGKWSVRSGTHLPDQQQTRQICRRRAEERMTRFRLKSSASKMARSVSA